MTAPKPKRSTKLRERMRARQRRNGDPCHICVAAGRDGTIDYTLKRPDPWSHEADHVVALDDGGLDVEENYAAAHLFCNRSKSSDKRKYGQVARPVPAAARRPAVYRCGCSEQGPHHHSDGAFYDHRPGAGVSFVTARRWTSR
jgi:hypothetical protein